MSDEQTLTPTDPATEAEIRAVLERAHKGDPGSLPALRAVLDAHPEIWRHFGDLSAHARDAWIGLIAGRDLALRESLVRQFEAMRAELAGPEPSPLEKLLAERIVATWLQLYHADLAVAQLGEVSLRQAAFALKRQDSASRRYLQAIGALAMVRRLLPTAEHSGRGTNEASACAGIDDVAAPMVLECRGPKPSQPDGGHPAGELPVLGFGSLPGAAVGGNRPGRRRRPKVSS